VAGKRKPRKIRLKKIWMRLRIFVKKFTEIFFQNALRKEQERFIEKRRPC